MAPPWITTTQTLVMSEIQEVGGEPASLNIYERTNLQINFLKARIDRKMCLNMNSDYFLAEVKSFVSRIKHESEQQ